MAELAVPKPRNGLEAWVWKFFLFKERGATSIGVEILAGAVIYMVSAYIIPVNPSILSFAGIPDLQGLGPAFAPTLTVTCLVAGLLTLAYGFWAKYPFMIAPGMGLNAFVAFSLVLGKNLAWQEAMSLVFLEGLAILLLVLTGLREAVMEAIPEFLKKAISVGIGIFILIIGMVNGGLIKMSGVPSAPLTIGDYNSIPFAVTVVGLAITTALFVRKVKGALLLGIILTTIVAIFLNGLSGWTAYTTPGVAVVPSALVSAPDFSNVGAPFANVDGRPAIVSVFVKLGVLDTILTSFSIMLSSFFDTMGTIIGIGAMAGFLVAGRFPQGDLRKILTIDSLGAMLGGVAGSSDATTYIESASGTQAGGRTGLAAVVTGLLFLASMFFAPAAGVIPPQATAPALILVGLFMCAVIADIDWRDPEVGLPALATVTLMPFTYSITNGIGWGFILFTFIKLVRGRASEVHWMMWLASGAFVLYFALPWLQATFGF